MANEDGDVLLKGFGFSGYRSFGNDLAKVGPLQRVNFIIGKNNTGKSNIVKFLKEQYSYFVFKAQNQGKFDKEIPFKELDKHISKDRVEHRISFPIFSNDIEEYITSKLPDHSKQSFNHRLIKKLLYSHYFSDKNKDVWFTYKSGSHTGEFYLELVDDDIIRVLEYREWMLLWTSLTDRSGGDIEKDWVPETLRLLTHIPPQVPNIEVIPAIRKIGGAGSHANDFSGEGIIERLATIQNPLLNEQDKKEKFRAINEFVQEVLENRSAEINIPHDRGAILIRMDSKTLPLESLGTGVHEVVILAAAATLLEDTILCVEEPELHIHPLLQRKLVKYLADSTNNQYFFTTHSAHLLDVADSGIFHITQSDGASCVNAIASTKERSNICSDLGYKASDILQANCIIWVEGPSDRIYLNYWISNKDSKLIEGVHYSIMFYGGRLSSHLSALDDDEMESRLEDLISVRNLNRNTVIILDSDKKYSNFQINDTKQRLKFECDSGPGFAWITEGREIENYLNYDKVKESFMAVHPPVSQFFAKGKWKSLLKYKKTGSKNERTANKVKVAKHYVKNNDVNFNVFDLNERMDELCDFILKANGSKI